jgi:hypothetical protein
MYIRFSLICGFVKAIRNATRSKILEEVFCEMGTTLVGSAISTSNVIER